MTLPAEDLWAGVDAGTQSVRVVVLTGAGELRGRGATPLTGRRDGPRHEQDPEAWWDALATASRQAMSGVDGRAVRGVAVAATSGTILLTGPDGEPLTPGLMYDDTRAAAEAERAGDAGRELWERLGYRRMQPAWALPKLLWLLDHRPGLAEHARLAHQSDFLAGRLAGHPVATDLSNALKTGVDLIAGGWPRPVMDALGVPARLLPPVVRPGARLGEVGRRAAELTGLRAGTPIFAGATDGCAAQFAAGVVEVGDWSTVIGTTLVLKGVSEALVADPSGALYAHRSPDGRWLPGGASGSGGGAIAAELPGRDLDALAERAAAYEPSGVLSYPLASARGERFPFVAPDATPFRLGEPRDDAELYASLLQGVGYVERLCFDHLARLGVPVHGRRVVTGGGAVSAYWTRLRADIMGRPVTVPRHTDPAVGMAVLAAASEHGLRGATSAMVRVAEVVEPRPGSAERFTEPYLRLVDELHERGWIDDDLRDRSRVDRTGLGGDT